MSTMVPKRAEVNAGALTQVQGEKIQLMSKRGHMCTVVWDKVSVSLDQNQSFFLPYCTITLVYCSMKIILD